MNRFTPDYVDRHMSSSAKSGDIGEVCQLDGTVSLQPAAAALKFMVIFACLFISAFIFIAWWFIDGPDKWLPMVMGPICGGLAFGFIFWITKRNIDRGPYIEFEASTNRILVPRLNLELDRNEIEYLQLITGRSKTLPDVQMNLNLVVRENDKLYRYLIMPSPHRAYVLEFAGLSKLEVREVKLGSNGFRDDSLLTVEMEE